MSVWRCSCKLNECPEACKTMLSCARLLSARRRRHLPSGPLAIACIALIGASIWIYPSLGPISRGEHASGAAAASTANQAAVRIKTKSQGILDINDNVGAKFLMVQCHRGQFSNRLQCLKLGIVLARALDRVLVMPMFTDTEPTVDVSKYVSMECLRRNSQAVTFEEFRQQICRDMGLQTTQLGSAAVVQPGTHGNATDFPRGAFCDDHTVLQLGTSFSLSDYRGYNCWNRREDIKNARDLGVHVSGCSHVPPRGGPGGRSYSLADIRRHFGGRTERVLLFLDLFGVDMITSLADLADTVTEPGQMCSWMPTEAAAAAADTVMQILIPPGDMQLPLGALSAAGDAAAAAAAATGGAAAQPGLTAVQDPTSHRTLFMGPAELTREPPPVRLRGVRRYGAVHLRRSDWFYYCGGNSHCFYSITEAGAWLNETLAARGLDTLYVSTNADAREKMMLRRAVTGRVLYWEDALLQLRSWQMEGAAEGAQRDRDGGGADIAAAAAAAATAAQAHGAGAPPWLLSLPLDDDLMVQMVEKAICMQAAFFISSVGSTFSAQIRSFRNGGLEDSELDAIQDKFPAAAAAAVPSGLAAGTAAASHAGGDTDAGAAAVSPRENATWLCDMRLPLYPDQRRLPDYHNPKIFLEEVHVAFKPLLDSTHRAWQQMTTKESASAGTSGAAADAPVEAEVRSPGATLPQLMASPARALEWLALVVQDGHAMAAANRFVDMYTGGALAALAVEGTLRATPAALADCVVSAAAGAGAVSLHVSLVDVPEEQQVLLMQELESRRELAQVTRMGGPEQERESTFTLLWRGEGLSRHAEPALLEELPTFLGRVDAYVLAKARVLLGDPRGAVFRQAENTRRLFGYDDPRDGACAPASLSSSDMQGAL